MSSVVKAGLAIAIVGLAACGQQEDAINNFVATEEINAAMTDENMMMGNDAGTGMTGPLPAPEANVAATAKVAPAQPTKTAPQASAPAKPAAPAEPKAAQPNAPDPTCLPEHRAAGHC